MAITVHYFWGNLLIKNINSYELGDTLTQELQRYINIYEKEYLVELFGEENYNIYIQDPENIKFTELNKLLYDTINYKSPIANYIYFNICKNNNEISESNAIFNTKNLTAVYTEMVTDSLKVYIYLIKNAIFENYNVKFPFAFINDFDI